MSLAPRTITWTQWLIQGALWILVLYLGFQIYGTTGHDDPHGNLWFAKSLVDTGEMNNYNGVRSLQTTNILQSLVAAVGALILPFDLITTGYLVDAFAALACCVAITKITRRIMPSIAIYPAWLMLGSPSFLFWCFGGMGSILAALCVLLCAPVWFDFITTDRTRKKNWLALLLVTAAMLLVRPEMPLILISVSLFLLVFYHRNTVYRQRIIYIVLISILAWVALLLWQKINFGAWFPLAILAKRSGNLLGDMRNGLVYVLTRTEINTSLILAWCALPFLYWRHCMQAQQATTTSGNNQKLWLLLLGGFLGAYYGFVWLVGGDWMEAGRFLVPVIPVACLLIVLAASTWLRHSFWFATLALCTIATNQHQWQGNLIAKSSHGVPVWADYRLSPEHERYSIFERYNQEHLRDMAVIDHLKEIIPPLHQALGRRVHILSGQSGMVYYRIAEAFQGQVYFLSLRGLLDDSLTKCPLTHNIKRTPMGLAWSYREFLPLLPALQRQCGFKAPDIIYDIDDLFTSFNPDFVKAGYTMIHREEGFTISNFFNKIPSNALMVPNVIFVRDDLLPILGNPSLRVIHYNQLPLQQRPGKEIAQAILKCMLSLECLPTNP